MIKDIIKTARPEHYTKNLFVFAALIFSKEFIHIESVIDTIYTFLVFCLSASAVYFINDLFDISQDKLHIDKKNRPIASGRVSKKQAASASILLCITAILILSLIHI